mmetsp:Transcript_24165/g.18403  ORF Transcript_24165/g.18403 Transcript_24165/m.18403 type:complete len:101 (+) Transcript_24165:33-335(+)
MFKSLLVLLLIGACFSSEMPENLQSLISGVAKVMEGSSNEVVCTEYVDESGYTHHSCEGLTSDGITYEDVEWVEGFDGTYNFVEVHEVQYRDGAVYLTHD